MVAEEGGHATLLVGARPVEGGVLEVETRDGWDRVALLVKMSADLGPLVEGVVRAQRSFAESLSLIRAATVTFSGQIASHRRALRRAFRIAEPRLRLRGHDPRRRKHRLLRARATRCQQRRVGSRGTR